MLGILLATCMDAHIYILPSYLCILYEHSEPLKDAAVGCFSFRILDSVFFMRGVLRSQSGNGIP
jgi:hypothetical protein